ncbi:MAG: PIG-L family deacetylase [Candidatus Kapabacteria bacterium]|nr:PIG-L family deacetylase [Candidatus Kapabacteria bacterium]
MNLIAGIIVLLLISSASLVAQPKVLIVNAHPDDESGCAATVYKLTHDLKATVDLCLITNGEAGFKYSTLAESWYGYELTDEITGRLHLPRIRKQEMMNAGKIIGLRNIIFLEHLDHRYTTDVEEVFRDAWKKDIVRAQIQSLLEKGSYDYVFVLLPTPETHGGHKGASILALEAVRALPADKRPIVLGVGLGRSASTADSTIQTPKTLAEYPITSLKSGTPPFIFNRAAKFGFNDRLNYKIIVQWLVAEHKSQGTVQLGIGDIDSEYFWYFDMNPPDGVATVAKLFHELSILRFTKKTY